MKQEHFLTPYKKRNSEWIKDFNIRPEPITILEENSGSTFFNINCTNILFDSSPSAKEIQMNINNVT